MKQFILQTSDIHHDDQYFLINADTQEAANEFAVAHVNAHKAWMTYPVMSKLKLATGTEYRCGECGPYIKADLVIYYTGSEENDLMLKKTYNY